MTAYRFCRTDDIDLLVSAWNACRGPEDSAAAPLDRVGFKDLIREQDLWCSSCMVAFEGREPVGVLLGCKRPDATLVYGVRVRPDHRRRGHARHLLTSLGQKLAILGPPRLVAEVPAERVAARALFARCGWIEDARLTDWRRAPSVPAPGGHPLTPIRVADLSATPAARCWSRETASLSKLDPEGLGIHSPDRLEAWLFVRDGAVLALGAEPGDLGSAALRTLIEAAGDRPLHLERAALTEIAPETLEGLGFQPTATHRVYSTQAKPA